MDGWAREQNGTLLFDVIATKAAIYFNEKTGEVKWSGYILVLETFPELKSVKHCKKKTKKKQQLKTNCLITHLSSSIFFFIMSLLQAGIEARRCASSSACEDTERVRDGGKKWGPKSVSCGV